MKFVGTTVLAALLLFLNSTGANAQSVKAGGPSGIIVSGSALVPGGGGSPVTILTAAATEFTILTQLCVVPLEDADVNWNVNITGSSIGTLVRAESGTPTEPCINFNPGIVLPANEAIRCEEVTGNQDVRCFASGVRTKK